MGIAHVARVSVGMMLCTVRESQALDAVAVEWACQEAKQRALRVWCSWTGAHRRQRFACEQVRLTVYRIVSSVRGSHDRD